MSEEIKEPIKKYLEAWKKRDYRKMLSSSTATYKHRYPDPATLGGVFPVKIKKYRVLKVVQQSDVVADAWAAVELNGEAVTLQIRLIKEFQAYVPMKGGSWGVNPISIRQLVDPATKN